MATSYEIAIYRPRLERAQAFQDYVAMRLLHEGIVLVNIQSRQHQYDVGENLLGMEIKHDTKFATTGNLWIEIEEKSDPSNVRYVPSGIFREDNSWLYGIGNEAEFFIFSKRTLRLLTRDRLIRENDTRTSRGFLLKRAEISELAERCFSFAPARRQAQSSVQR